MCVMQQFDEANTDEAQAHGFSDDVIPGAVEAVLLASEKPLTPMRIAQALGLDEGGSAIVKEVIDELNAAYEREGRSFRIEPVAGGVRVMTLPEYAGAVAAIRGLRESGKLSKAAVETLAIVAYRQPVTRAEIEGIRGVACGEVLRTLLERRLCEITGRAEELGRPMLYGTSKRFLEAFGLASLKELPEVDQFNPAQALRAFEQKPEAEPDAVSTVEGAADEGVEDAPATA